MFITLKQLQEKIAKKPLKLTNSFEKEYNLLIKNLNQREENARRQGVTIPGFETINREGGDSTTVNNPLLSTVHLSNYLAVARIIESLVEKKSNLAKIRILGVGEGAGVFAYYLASVLKPEAYLATDYQRQLVNYGRAILSGDPLTFARIDATIMASIKNDSFDVIVACEFIEHISTKDLVAFLKECRRVLRKDGVVVTTTPNRGCHPGEKFSNYPHHFTEFTTDDLHSLIKSHLAKHFKQHTIFYLVNERISQEKRHRFPLEQIVNRLFAILLKLFPKGSQREKVFDQSLTSLHKIIRKEERRKRLTFPKEYGQTKLTYRPADAKKAFGLCLVLQVR